MSECKPSVRPRVVLSLIACCARFVLFLCFSHPAISFVQLLFYFPSLPLIADSNPIDPSKASVIFYFNISHKFENAARDVYHLSYYLAFFLK